MSLAQGTQVASHSVRRRAPSGGAKRDTLRLWVVFAAVVLCVVLSGCHGLGCRSDSSGTEGASWPADASTLRHVPSDASVVMLLREAAYLARITDYKHSLSEIRASEAEGSTPGKWSGWPDRWASNVFSSSNADLNDDASVAESAPAVFFMHDGVSVVGAETNETGSLVEHLSASGVQWLSPGDSPRRGWLPGRDGESSSGGAVVCLSNDEVFAIRSLGGHDSRSRPSDDEIRRDCDQIVARGEAVSSGSDWTSRWTRSADEASLMESLVGGSEIAATLVRPDVMLRPSDEADGGGARHARTLTSRLASQLGSVGGTVYHRPDIGALSVTFRLQQAAGVPMAIGDLGSATGSLPPMGGLVDEETLGAVRLSADPELTYQLARSLLPAETRQKLDTYWKEFRTELTLEMPGSLIESLSGHAVIAVLGIRRNVREDQEDDGDEASGKAKRLTGPWRRLLSGAATQEAIMIPLTNRTPIERALNLVTQMSRGKLSRDMAGEAVHYAWVGEEGLSWALVLTDDYLVFADSGKAFNRAVHFSRDSTSLDDALWSRDLQRLFEGSTRSGFYVDARRATQRLRASDWREAAAYTDPWNWVLFTSETAGSEMIGRLDVGYRSFDGESAPGGDASTRDQADSVD